MIKINNTGSSMISVIVSFVILLMGISMFTSAMFTATDLTKEADDVRQRVSVATEKFYSRVHTSDIVTEEKLSGITLQPTDGGDSFLIDGTGYAWKCEEDYTMYYFAHNQNGD